MEPSARGQQDVMKVTAMLLNKDHSVRDVNDCGVVDHSMGIETEALRTVENALAIDFKGARK